MSYWLHMNGVIMLSTYEEYDKVENFLKNEVFGETASFGEETKSEIAMPEGSEGTADYTITECDGYIQIIISGNLRELENKDLEEIEKWYIGVLNKINSYNGISVREQIFVAYVNHGNKIIITDKHTNIYENQGIEVIRFGKREEY